MTYGKAKRVTKESVRDRYGSYGMMVSFNMFKRLSTIDHKNIGTADYMGLAYFWNYEYRHYMRDATARQRVKVHDAMVLAGLDPVGESSQHLAIVQKYVRQS